MSKRKNAHAEAVCQLWQGQGQWWGRGQGRGLLAALYFFRYVLFAAALLVYTVVNIGASFTAFWDILIPAYNERTND